MCVSVYSCVCMYMGVTVRVIVLCVFVFHCVCAYVCVCLHFFFGGCVGVGISV